MTCIAMQPLITSCCYEGMRMLHAVRPAQRRRPRDGAAGIRAAPEGRRFKEAAAAHPAATRQGTVVGWPPRRCGKMAGQAFLWLLYFIFFLVHGHSLIGQSAAPRLVHRPLPPLLFAPEVGISNRVKAAVR